MYVFLKGIKTDPEKATRSHKIWRGFLKIPSRHRFQYSNGIYNNLDNLGLAHVFGNLDVEMAQSLLLPYDKGNNHPATSCLRIPRYQGFDPYDHCHPIIIPVSRIIP